MHKVYLFLSLFIAATFNVTAADKTIAESADRVTPLLVGQQIPDVKTTDTNGEAILLSDVINNKPTILFFYRGGWCPFCTQYLG